MIVRDRAATLAAAAVTVTLTAVGAPVAGPLAALPVAVSVGALIGLIIGWRGFVAWPVTIAGAISLATTAIMLVARPESGRVVGVLGLVESAALLILVATAVRWASKWSAVVAGLTAGIAVSVWILRALPTQAVGEQILACLLWTVGPAGAVLVGGYPRLAELRRRRSVAAAQRSQRLAVARDLHDYVAHDIGGIVVAAQAARYVGATDPGRAMEALERIEAAGLRALAAMDRTVAMLSEPAANANLPGLRELPELVARFAEEATARVEVDLATGPPIPDAIGSTAYRIVVEALSNIRRHAPDASTIRVRATHTPTSGLIVTITDDGGNRRAATADRGGFGLIGLTQRAHALGGSLTAGPHAGGWQLIAVLPNGETP